MYRLEFFRLLYYPPRHQHAVGARPCRPRVYLDHFCRPIAARCVQHLGAQAPSLLERARVHLAPFLIPSVVPLRVRSMETACTCGEEGGGGGAQQRVRSPSNQHGSLINHILWRELKQHKYDTGV